MAGPLDSAHAAMMAVPEDSAARAAYYRALVDCELYLLLAREAEDDRIEPRTVTVDGGDMILAFDDEARLAAFAEGPLPYAALPGRVIFGLMAGRGLTLGLNLGGEDGAFVMPPEIVDWLVARLGDAPLADQKPAGGWKPLAEAAPLAAAITAALGPAAPLCQGAWLASARADGDAPTPAVIFVGARPEAEAALAKAASEALAFSGRIEGRAEVYFLTKADFDASTLPSVARAIPLQAPPEPAPARASPPAAPGGDPDRPPRLR